MSSDDFMADVDSLRSVLRRLRRFPDSPPEHLSRAATVLRARLEHRLDGGEGGWLAPAELEELGIRRNLPVPVSLSSGASGPLVVALVFAETDTPLRHELAARLDPLESRGGIEVCVVTCGARGEQPLDTNERILARADVVIIGISKEILASTEYSTLVRPVLERRRRMIPVVLRQVDWDPSLFASLSQAHHTLHLGHGLPLHGRSSDELRASEERAIEELMQVCCDHHTAHVIATKAGIPRMWQPVFSMSVQFWPAIVERARSEMSSGGVLSIIEAARVFYPHNAVFDAYCRASSAAPPPQRERLIKAFPDRNAAWSLVLQEIHDALAS